MYVLITYWSTAPTKSIQIKNHHQESECIAHWSVDLWLQSYHRHALATRLDTSNPPGKKLFMFRFEISTTTRNHQKLSEQNPKEWPVQISCCGLPHVMHVPSVLIAAKALSVAWMLQTLTSWSLTPELSPPCGPLPQVTTLGMTKKNKLRNPKATTLPPTHRFGTLSYVR